MAREYDLETEAKPMREPLHERVLVLEKQGREMREQLEEQGAMLRKFIEGVSRELGL